MDSCLSGQEAINLVKNNTYDLVLLDHMMPGMDGIETVKAIRDWETGQRKNAREFPKETPVIALTANAVSGMKEMFLQHGFSDYLSKPIEIYKLNNIIEKWIPAEKRIKARIEIKRETFSGETGIIIPGVNVKQGINMTGGTEAGYRQVLTQFRKDAGERLPLLKNQPEEKDLPLFTTHVHALKSAAATIGAEELSKEAAELEAAGKAGDVTIIEEKLPVFYGRLKETAEKIGAALAETRNTESGGPFLSITDPGIRSLFLELKAALEAKDMESMDRLTEELIRKNLNKETAETVNTVSDLLLVSKFKAAAEKLEKFLKIN
jgi:CheY-like chemotaxis protein